MSISLKKNIIFNFIGTFSKLFIPFLSFSFVSHVLKNDGIGRVNYAFSIVSFFVILAKVGIDSYGIREGAKMRDNIEKISQFTIEMFFLSLFTTIFSVVLLLELTFLYEPFEEYRLLLLVFGVQVVFAPLNYEWLCCAYEEYVFINKRIIIIQFVSLILCIVCVRDENGYLIYAIIMALAVVATNIINTSFALHKIKIKKYDLNIIRHIKPTFILLGRSISIEIYTHLDSVMLGLIAGSVSVGNYTMAVKLNKVFTPLISSIGAVLIPRLSYWISKGEDEKRRRAIYKSSKIVWMLALPTVCYLEIFNYFCVELIGGSSFLSAGRTMQIISPVTLLIPLSTIINDQILIPFKKEKAVLYTTLGGAIVNIIANYFLIKLYNENGAAVATVLSEIVVLAIGLFYAKEFINIKKIIACCGKYLIATIITGLFMCSVIYILNIDPISFFNIGIGFAGVIVYIVILMILKDDIVKAIFDLLKRKRKKCVE